MGKAGCKGKFDWCKLNGNMTMRFPSLSPAINKGVDEFWFSVCWLISNVLAQVLRVRWLAFKICSLVLANDTSFKRVWFGSFIWAMGFLIVPVILNKELNNNLYISLPGDKSIQAKMLPLFRQKNCLSIVSGIYYLAMSLNPTISISIFISTSF